MGSTVLEHSVEHKDSVLYLRSLTLATPKATTNTTTTSRNDDPPLKWYSNDSFNVFIGYPSIWDTDHQSILSVTTPPR
jgi:hypothetical protein